MEQSLDALIGRLWCQHWPAARLPAGTAAEFRGSGVFLDTCLRQLAFGLAPRPGLALAPPGEIHTGPAAYRLLLEVASGLRSAVPGETNVFGQFRRAWEQAATDLATDYRGQLAPVVAALVADTRTLRARHLEGMAGTSYGSLVRELLAPRRDSRVLFVGTGDLARSMLPLFRNHAVGAWNHRAAAPLADVCRWFPAAEADGAAAWATDIVFTTPADPDHDAGWHDRLLPHAHRAIVHLGQRRSTACRWPSAAARFDLDDVFALAGARDQHRTRQLAAAARSCTALVEARLGATQMPGMAFRAAPLHA